MSKTRKRVKSGNVAEQNLLFVRQGQLNTKSLFWSGSLYSHAVYQKSHALRSNPGGATKRLTDDELQVCQNGELGCRYFMLSFCSVLWPDLASFTCMRQ